MKPYERVIGAVEDSLYEWVLTNIDRGPRHLVAAEDLSRTRCGRPCADWPWRHSGDFDCVDCKRCIRAVRGQGRQALRISLSKFKEGEG